MIERIPHGRATGSLGGANENQPRVTAYFYPIARRGGPVTLGVPTVHGPVETESR